MMNWEAIGAIGEIVGAGAVVSSLAYLAIQIRTQIRQQSKLVIDKLTEHSLDMLETQVRPEIASVWAKGMSDYESLDLPEKIQVVSLVGRVLRISEGFYLSYKNGDLGLELWEGQKAMLNDFLINDGVRSVWAIRKTWYARTFREYVDQSINEATGKPLFSGAKNE